MSADRNHASPAEALAYLTECNLATLEVLRSRKTASKSSMERQLRICRVAIEDCRRFVTPEDARRAKAMRVFDILSGAKEAP